MTTRPDEARLGQWPLGVDNVSDVQSLGLKALRAGVNIDIDKVGNTRRRRGYTLVSAGVSHSVWSEEGWPFALYVKGSDLVKLTLVDGVETLTTLTTVAPFRRMSYAAMNDAAYLSNGVDRYQVTKNGALTPWGVPNPGGQPFASANGGAAGDANVANVQVAVTYLLSTGEESGTGEATVVAGRSDTTSVAVTGIPQPPAGMGVTHIQVYVSAPNGSALFASAKVAVGTTSASAPSPGKGKALETQFCDRVPAADIVRAYRGRLYLAVGDTLYYTLALRFGLYKIHGTYVRFPGTITMVQPVEGGIFVGTTRSTYFLAGDDPTKMKLEPVDSFGAVWYTGMHTKRFSYDVRQPPTPCALWWSTNGVLMCGRDDGSVSQVTLNRLALPSFTSGATMLREVNGVRQVVSVLKGPGEQAALAAQDSAVAQVIRNGVVIPV